MKEHLYWISLSYATFGVVTDLTGKITEFAPIHKWVNGKYISFVKRYFEGKGGTVIQVY